ncbi:MAG: hypothetical protein WA144_06000 [Candidatus Methanoperedens sp.]
MREILKSGSVRGLIVTLGAITSIKGGYGLYSTVHREKHHGSVLSVDSVVDFPCDEHYLKNKLNNKRNQ